MKYFLTILFLISIASCKNNVAASFDIHIENADKYDKSPHDLVKIDIYKDHKIFRILEAEEPILGLDRNIKIDSIKDGKYSFVYENIFGDEVKNEVIINESRVYRIAINPDKLTKKIDNLAFGNLKNDEVKVVYKSRGCFHMDEDSITIVNKGNDYFIQQKGKLKKINKEVWAYFVNTENKIRQIPKDGGCTTSDIYIFNYKGKSDTIIDGTCDFEVWSTIKDYLKKNKLQ